MSAVPPVARRHTPIFQRFERLSKQSRLCAADEHFALPPARQSVPHIFGAEIPKYSAQGGPPCASTGFQFRKSGEMPSPAEVKTRGKMSPLWLSGGEAMAGSRCHSIAWNSGLPLPSLTDARTPCARGTCTLGRGFGRSCRHGPPKPSESSQNSPFLNSGFQLNSASKLKCNGRCNRHGSRWIHKIRPLGIETAGPDGFRCPFSLHQGETAPPCRE